MKKEFFENKIEGFSKISKKEKIEWIESNYFKNKSTSILEKYWNKDEALQKIHDEFTENTISNFYLPLGVAPNFLIDGKDYTIPMVIEESSVIAAACKAAKFWRNKGGFKTQILNFKGLQYRVANLTLRVNSNYKKRNYNMSVYRLMIILDKFFM